MSAAPPPAPGWHPDPAGQFTHRYFDGIRWTANVADNGVQGQDAASLAFLNTAAPVAAAGPVTPKRSTAGFWIAGGVGALAVILAMALGIVRFVDTLSQPADYARTNVPGSVSTIVNDTGERVIYSEGSVRLPLSQLAITVTGPDGAPVPVRPYSASVTYDTAGHSGRAVGRFDAPVAGRYVVASRSVAVPGAEIAVGPDLFGDLIGIFTGPLLVLLGGLLLVGAILLFTFWWRRRPLPEPTGLP